MRVRAVADVERHTRDVQVGRAPPARADEPLIAASTQVVRRNDAWYKSEALDFIVK